MSDRTYPAYAEMARDNPKLPTISADGAVTHSPMQPQLKDEGFTPQCGCGWVGHCRGTYVMAQINLERHLETHLLA